MKLNKIAAIALAAVAMTACSDDDSNKLNSVAGVTVDMKSATYSVRENAKIFNVPFTVTGETNGDVIVYFETTENSTEGDAAIENENYIVTSYRIIVPAGSTSGSVEVCAVDNKDENDSRFFNMTITNVEGATVGSLATTVVEIRDNDQDPYDKLCGEGWHITGLTMFSNTPDLDVAAEMVAPDINDPDDAPYYGHELYLHFTYSGADMFITLSYEYDEINDEMSISIVPGNFACYSVFNFNGGAFQGVLVGCTAYDPNGYMGEDEPMTITIESGKVVEMVPENQSAEWYLGILNYPGFNQFMGYLNGWSDIVITRK